MFGWPHNSHNNRCRMSIRIKAIIFIYCKNKDLFLFLLRNADGSPCWQLQFSGRRKQNLLEFRALPIIIIVYKRQKNLLYHKVHLQYIWSPLEVRIKPTRVQSNFRFILYLKCSNCLVSNIEIVVKLWMFGFTFCYLDGANSIKTDLHKSVI